ncbi:MAG TPA: NAD(P)/FAD-dependent oxidoreductase [Candidatus Eremiobacteraceae bacterium]|nr:NAD(P)/FAD-dependent oxidoreductase [Candidatus Eremiobacteraceae bacterium]
MAEDTGARPIRIVILGGGFGGVYAAMRLQKLVRRRKGIDVTLVSRENFFLLTSMLPQVAASGIDTRHIVTPIRQICPHIRFYEAEVEAIDLAAKSVTIAAEDGPRHVLGYDHLLIALGGVTNFFGIPGVEEHTLAIKSLGDAVRLRNRALEMLERAELEDDDVVRSRLLSFAVVGAGFAGVETAAELDVFLHKAARWYHRFKPTDVKVALVDGGQRVLPDMRDRLGEITKKTLERRGMQIKLGVFVKSADADGLTLADGSRIDAKTIVWAGGVAANPLVAGLACADSRGRLEADATFAVKGQPGVWALGDCARVDSPLTGKPYPPTAQHAVRMGPRAADNIMAVIDGQPPKPFVYKMAGQMANLGEHQAVAMFGGLQVAGFPAWWIWRTYYLLRLPALDRRVRVAIDWTLDLIFGRDLVKLAPWEPPHR